MTKANKKSEETVFNILMDSKNEPHKFYVPYTYQVETKNFNIICELLLYFNISVNFKELLNNDTAVIDIIHVPSYREPKLTLNAKNELLNYSALDTDKISVSIENILKMIMFQEN